jgi:4,5-DOPA dioxygenase extradiol
MEKSERRMPVLFVGHGSPMNALEDNIYTRNWERIAADIPRPETILAVSAHWYTEKTRINDSEKPGMIYDMYGFPEELYRLKYDVKGSSEMADLTKSLISRKVETDNSWGCDHGTWSVLCRMYPKEAIPVYQLSIDMNASAEEHFQIGKEISSLRDRGVLILGSGNVVHNLSKVNWDMESGYPWAVEFDNYIKEKVTLRQFNEVVNYKSAGKSAEMAFNTPEHFYPLLYVLGASRDDDKLDIFNDSCIMGSLSMTCYLFS